MVKVYESGKFTVYVFPDDHGPAHCHIYSPGKNNFERHAKIAIESLELLENDGFSHNDIRLLKTLIFKRQNQLMKKWKEYHGD